MAGKKGKRRSQRLNFDELEEGLEVENSKPLKTFKILSVEIKRLLQKSESEEENSLKKVYFEAALECLQKLEEVYLELDDGDVAEQSLQFSEIKDDCLRRKVNFTNGINKNIVETSEGCSYKGNSNLRLPKLGLLEFQGEIHRWLSFKDVFSNAIIKNDSLNDLQRLTYLQSCVKNDAARIVRGFEITEGNFNNAWQSLLNRYENKKELTFAHLRKIFDLKCIKVANGKNLLEIVDVMNESLRNLKTLGFQLDQFSEIIFIFHIQNKLDPETLKQWELKCESQEIPTLKFFTEFLEKQSRGFLASTSVGSKSEYKSNKPSLISTNATIQQNIGVQCSLCNGNHPLFKCHQFNAMSLKDRWTVVKNKRLCSNCLKSKHFWKQCGSQTRCKNCHRAHHTSLHSYTSETSSFLGGRDKVSKISNQQGGLDKGLGDHMGRDGVPLPSETIHAPCLSFNADLGCNTLLSTAQIKVKNKHGHFINCRALLDNGSQKTLISKALQEKLDLPTQTSRHSIKGINNLKAETSVEDVWLHFSPYFNHDTFCVQALVVKNVTSNLPNFYIKPKSWPHLANLRLADPQFHISAPVDIIIGADLFFDLIVGKPIVGPKGSPSAMDTKLGFILSGTLWSNPVQTNFLACHSTVSLSHQLTKFWDLEGIPEIETMSPQDNLCEEWYQNSVSRTTDGRFCIGLPLKPNIILGDTYYPALQRLHFLEAKLTKHPDLRVKYNAFMQEYLDLQHMELVADNVKPDRVCYLPHHSVVNENSTTTKLRVVFNGSMKSSSGLSLNQALFTGPKLQPDLFSILMKFRIFPIALNADIMKMYRQIRISPPDDELQRILWRFHPADPIQEFRLQTVTYGLTSSPFLALRTLQQLALDGKDTFPEASNVVLNNFYIDDLLAGANTLEEAKKLISQLNSLMSTGGFTLRKWRSNCEDILQDIPPPLKATTESCELGEGQVPSILGIGWNSIQDTFHINVSPHTEVSSKRSLLSLIARTYDPIGMLSPTTITLKILLQELWKSKSNWDEKLPQDIATKWDSFRASIDVLRSIHIPCHLDLSNNLKKQLVGFADASPKAYAAVLYLRTVDDDQNIKIIFVAAKTKVAPTKTLTLPKLELCATLLLSKLVHSVLSAFSNSHLDLDVLLCSDSTIVLCWLKSDSQPSDVFVANRVSKIKSLTPKAIWSHVPSLENPADVASRGILPQQLLEHKLWWTGPSWLSNQSFSSNINTSHSTCLTSATVCTSVSTHHSTSQPLLESNDLTCNVNLTQSTPEFLLKFSSYPKLIRVTSWMLRFCHNIRFPADLKRGNLHVQELRTALTVIVKIIQGIEFATEFQCLKHRKPLPAKSKLHPLNVFLDQDEIIRVGGRLLQATELPVDKKHPMLLPAKHHFTTILVNHLHHIHLHAGAHLVLSFLRQQFWVINARNVIRKILHSCVTCFRMRATPCSQLMGNLPPERVTLIRPFKTVGVDFSGAFITKPNLPRSRTKIKSYICLFICLATKSVHLELVSELTTSCFLACLRRFISRRGIPTDIFSDNATNFRGAASHLHQFHSICKDSEIQHFCNDHLVQWHFIPAYAPNFGGLWEASIKLTKTHLLRVCKSAILNFEQLSTLLCQIEAVINSRPLFPLSTDPHDYQVLTPGHFLIGAPLLELPNPSPRSPSLPFSAKWDLIQKMRLHFWQRWSLEYLHHLQPRSKWAVSHPNLQVGQLVLIKDPNLPPLSWMTGRVSKVFPGSDGYVRVVSLTTRKGEISRSISKLAVFPDVHTPQIHSSSPLPGPEDVASQQEASTS